MPVVYALTLFLSATLLFLVQLIIAKMILPKFGGTPAVWNTSMVFFQAWLLAGYSYAHAMPSWLGTRRQVLVHLGLLLLPFAVLPFAVSDSYAPPGDAFPMPYVLLLLLVTVGLPFFMVSTSAPLLSRWFAKTGHHSSHDPYFLYAASNIGSMLALLGYPTLIEPYFTLRAQAWAWSAGFAMLVAAIGACAWLLWKSPSFALADAGSAPTAPPEPQTAATADRPNGTDEADGPPGDAPLTAVTTRQPKGKRKQRSGSTGKSSATAVAAPRPAPVRDLLEEMKSLRDEPITMAQRLRWVALAFVPSSLFLSVTTYLTTDIAAIPLLWVIPLALYLLSFILVFSEYGRKFLVALLGGVVLAGAAFVGLVTQSGSSALIWPLMGMAMLLGGAMLVVGVMWGWNAIQGKEAPFAILGKWKVEMAGHRILVVVMAVAIVVLMAQYLSGVPGLPMQAVAAVHLAVLFLVAMVCHGELARTRPATRYLTEFYLLMSLGGVLGGMFNALLAPVLFNRIAEYPLTMVLACLVLPSLFSKAKSRWARVLNIGLPVVVSLLAIGVVLSRWIDAYTTATELNASAVARSPDHATTGGGEAIPYTFWTPVESYARIGQLLSDQPMWKWSLLLIVLAALGYLVWAILMDLVARRKGLLRNRALDIAAALAIWVLATGLILKPPIGTQAPGMFMQRDMLGALTEYKTRFIIYGLLVLFCCAFVERPVRFGFCLGAFLLASSLSSDVAELNKGDRVLRRERSFFGAMAVKREGRYHRLLHGTTLHGMQYFSSDEEMAGVSIAPLMASNVLGAVSNERIGQWMWAKRREPLTYFHRTGPIGQVLAELGKRRPLPHLAVTGLGTGTLASYAQPGQKLTYYEIDPTVKQIAEDRSLFTYIADARDRGADVNIIMGDGRLQIRKAPEHAYGLIILDAFSSDAVPVHLITKEATQLYLDKLADDGILAFQITNRYVNLKPVLVNLAHEFDLAVLAQNDPGAGAIGKTTSQWVMLAKSQEAFGDLNKDIKRWPSDFQRHWDDPMHKPDAAHYSVQDLGRWRDGWLVLAERSGRQNMKNYHALRQRLSKMSPAEVRRGVQEEIDQGWNREQKVNQSVGVWTDDFSNLLKVFNIRD